MAALPAPLPILSSPRISAAQFAAILTAANSPAARENGEDTLYRICLDFRVDPAIALAFFLHESSLGTKSVARATKNWGNLRKSQGRATHVGPIVGSEGKGNFAWYATWADGLRDFLTLLRSAIYEGAGLKTVEAVIPKYAPSSDNNKPAQYIAAVRRAVATWQAAKAPADPWAAWGDAYPLPVEQRGFAIPAYWLPRAAQFGAATSDEFTAGLSPQRVALRVFERGWLLWSEATDTVTGQWA